MRKLLLGTISLITFVLLFFTNYNSSVQYEKLGVSLKYLKTSIANADSESGGSKNHCSKACIINGNAGVKCSQDYGNDCKTPGDCIPI